MAGQLVSSTDRNKYERLLYTNGIYTITEHGIPQIQKALTLCMVKEAKISLWYINIVTSQINYTFLNSICFATSNPLTFLGTMLRTKEKTYFKVTGWISRIFAQARKLSWCLASKITRYKLRCPLNRSTVTDVSPESWYTLVNEESCDLGPPATFTLPMRESRSPTAWPRVGEKTGSNTNCRKLQFSRDLSAWQKKRKMW